MSEILENSHFWFAVYTRPKLEAVAVENLIAQGFDAYLPLYKQFKKNGENFIVIFEPMFPRYVFFRPVNSAQSILPVSSTRGVSHVIRFGSQIAKIAPEVLNAIRHIEIERTALDEDELIKLRPGDRVRINEKALKGIEGVVNEVSSRRVSVLLQILGRPLLVNIEPHRLESA